MSGRQFGKLAGAAAAGGMLPGNFPPLAGNHDLYRDRMFPVYVRAAWSNAEMRPAGFVDIDEQAVAKARNKPMKPAEVHAFRAAHR